MRGFLVGVLVLVALDRVIGNRNASGRVASLFAIPAELARRFLDPNVPALGGAHTRPLDSSAPYPGTYGAAAPATPAAPSTPSAGPQPPGYVLAPPIGGGGTGERKR